MDWQNSYTDRHQTIPRSFPVNSKPRHLRWIIFLIIIIIIIKEPCQRGFPAAVKKPAALVAPSNIPPRESAIATQIDTPWKKYHDK